LDEEEAIPIFLGILTAVCDLHQHRVFHRMICDKTVYFAPPGSICLTGFYKAVQYGEEEVPPEEDFNDEILALGNFLSGMVPSQRSRPLQDLIDGMIDPDTEKRLTLQQVIEHESLQRGLVDGMIDKALLFESIPGLR
jgi:serine/threonine protein kinase